MGKRNNISKLKESFLIVIISLIGCVGIVFSVLYVETFDSGFFNTYSTPVVSVAVGLISVITVLTIMFLRESKRVVFKLFLLAVIFISLAVLCLYLLKIVGFLDKITSVEDFRNYISSFGGYAVVLFILIQYLQVVVLPIPSFITVGAGVLLFGPLKGAIFSCVGIILGSLSAYFIGRVFGFKVAKWLIGEEDLNKWLKNIKGKDKVVLTFMFLFPFFPDDVLCFVAGITTIGPCFFTIMIILTRLITVFASSFSMNNSLIPYDTWWGILLWIVFFSITIVLTILVYKKGDKLENKFKRKRDNH